MADPATNLESDFIPTGTNIQFVADRDLNKESVEQLIANALKIGLATEFQTGYLTPEQLFERHLSTTAINSPESWVGKEHFMELGDAVQINRSVSSKLFTVVVFPVHLNDHGHYRAVDPNELGLRVSTREAETVPYPPPHIVKKYIGRGYPSTNEIQHERRFNSSGVMNSVMQAGSIVASPEVYSRANFVGIQSAMLGKLSMLAGEVKYRMNASSPPGKSDS